LCVPVVAEEESDPNSAEVDGLAFFVEDADDAADDEEIDPAEVEIVDDIPAEVWQLLRLHGHRGWLAAEGGCRAQL
jgi:hypothetical protein